MFLLVVVVSCYTINGILCVYNQTTKHTIEDDYYLNYDYELTSNTSENLVVKTDSLILPNPESLDAKYTVDDLPNIELPDDSLADTDLRDHDFIDNLMYVYYGSHSKNNRSYGSEIIIVGSVLSCAAQLMTFICVLLRKNLHHKKEMSKMFLHLIGCFCFTNLVFMLGVYATKNSTKCQIVAIILHYLHLLAAFWIFLYCYYIYLRLSNNKIPKLNYLLFLAYGSPALWSMASFVIAPQSYETKKFCFLSVQKGMLLNYMLPISILIIITTIYSLNGIRKINLGLSKLEMTSSAESLNMLRTEMETLEGEKKLESTPYDEVITLKESKSCFKVLCIIQMSYDVVWFIAVLALENVNYSNVMPIFFALFSSSLNWYIFVKTKAFLPTISSNTEVINVETGYVEPEKVTSERDISISIHNSSDSIPLLINCDSSTEMCELMRQDSISTISN